MNEKILVGKSHGRFVNANGEVIDYCSIYVLEPFKSSGKDNFSEGMKASKYPCTSPDVFKGIELNSKIDCDYDESRKIKRIHVVQ